LIAGISTEGEASSKRKVSDIKAVRHQDNCHDAAVAQSISALLQREKGRRLGPERALTLPMRRLGRGRSHGENMKILLNIKFLSINGGSKGRSALARLLMQK
jgi:hypothetical protein